jgi:hypothetical protein
MAKNRDLLKEAIADAKAVREMAIANAKSALEETFSPRIKEMFSAKLQEMENEEELEEAGDGMKGNIPEAEEEMYEEELNLDELLAELEEDEEPLNESEDEEESEDDEEGESLDLEDMTDEDLKQMIEDVISDMISSGELEAGEATEEEPEDMETEMEDEEVSIEELLREIEEEDMNETEVVNEIGFGLNDMEAIISMVAPALAIATGFGINVIKNKLANAKSAKELKAKMEQIANEEGSPNKELEEAYSTIETLRTDLNEVNLLNAKLLYTNKIFKAKNLNESQKVKVLSSFDKASTVNEVKLVFETLNEGLKVKTPIKEHLGSASKSILPPNTKQPIVEENETFKRMQQLAFYKSEY